MLRHRSDCSAPTRSHCNIFGRFSPGAKRNNRGFALTLDSGEYIHRRKSHMACRRRPTHLRVSGEKPNMLLRVSDAATFQHKTGLRPSVTTGKIQQQHVLLEFLRSLAPLPVESAMSAFCTFLKSPSFLTSLLYRYIRWARGPRSEDSRTETRGSTTRSPRPKESRSETRGSKTGGPRGPMLEDSRSEDWGPEDSRPETRGQKTRGPKTRRPEARRLAVRRLEARRLEDPRPEARGSKTRGPKTRDPRPEAR